MAITELFTFTEAVGSTEWSATTDSAGPGVNTADGVFQFVADLSDMVAGDELQIRCYEKVRSGDTQRVVYECSVCDAQALPIWISPSLVLMHGWDWTFKAIMGTITVLGSVRQVA